MRWSIKHLVALGLAGPALLMHACGGGGGTAEEPPPSYSLALDFERLPPDTMSPFAVDVTLRRDGALLGGKVADLAISLGRGAYDIPAEVSPGRYRFTVTPSQTGEHLVTVAYGTVSVTRTALVLETVDPGWGQPMAVEGLVNTAGYEDGVTVTPDGEYLFVQYGPHYFSGLHLFGLPRAAGGCGGDRLSPDRCTHPWIDSTIGPYDAPERPGFFDGRISGGVLLHNSNAWGVGIEEVPILAPATMFYGFHRQADGSFAEPFYLAFDDENDAVTNPYGLSFMLHVDNTATVLFSLDDPTDPDLVDLDGNGSYDVQSLADVYTAEVTLGQNNILGTFVASGVPGTPPVRSTPFPARLVDFGKTGTDGIAGTQGNSHLYEVGGSVRSIWTDDEYDHDADYGDISAYVLTGGAFPGGSWSKVVLPTVVNRPSPDNEIQPFFTGSGLYFTHGSDSELPEIFYSAYSGTDSVADYQDGANWATPVKVLGVGSFDAIGKVIAIGEPTVATRGDGEYLYFVYGVIRDNGDPSGLADIDMQAGFVRKR